MTKKNITVRRDGNDELLISYATPVAVWIEGFGAFVTETKYSKTTSRHINEWLRHHNIERPRMVDQSMLDMAMQRFV